MAKKNSTASKKPMIFNSVIMINAENVVSLVKCLPKTRMKEEAFNTYMENSFIFGGKNHGMDFNAGSHYSTVVRQLGLYHILNNEYIPRFTFDIDNKTADSYLRYWLKLYVVPNPTSQPSLKKNTINPKYILKELIDFIEANPYPTNIYDIVDRIFNQELSRNDKGNLPNIINEYSDCISINDNNEVSLTPNYKQVMAEINELINNPNRYFEHFGEIKAPASTKNKSLQVIYYGAPGTGKSHEIKRQTSGCSVIRTTFHPDSDYSTFVGAYKPTMVEVNCPTFPDGNGNGINLNQPQGTYTEKRISYQFVKQAFLKAYLGAWKKYSEWNNNPFCTPKKQISTISFETDKAKYTIQKIDDNGIKLSKYSEVDKNAVKNIWDSLWHDGIFEIPTGSQSGTSIQQAISKWIFDNCDNIGENDFDKGWNILLAMLKGNIVLATKEGDNTQVYELSYIDNNENKIAIHSEMSRRKNTIKQYFESNQNNTNLEKELVNKLKKYSEDNFKIAWQKITDEISDNSTIVSSSSSSSSCEPQFLIIEEINRGNCAQIFGDLFQLLDRAENGFSEYPIEADTDLQKEIERSFKDEDNYMINGEIIIKEAINYNSNYGETLSEDVQHGRVLLLPPNLFIWATMNTSDQSLFPIDSAFKRRWDWEYMPIENGEKGWKIELDDRHELIDWWDFLKRINIIISELTISEDKQLGYYFCQPDKKDSNGNMTVISSKHFVDKVIFYLWNDVFKDYAFDALCCKGEDNKEVLFAKFYNDGEKSININTLTRFFETLKKDKETSLVKLIKQPGERADEQQVNEDGVNNEVETVVKDNPAE